MDRSETYNVVCRACGQIFRPKSRSALWYKAKRRSDEGYLDALTVPGEDCGCTPQIRHPDAPYRVFGFDDIGNCFDTPHDQLVPAVRDFLEIAREGIGVEVFFEGGSDALRNKLEELRWLPSRLESALWGEEEDVPGYHTLCGVCGGFYWSEDGPCPDCSSIEEETSCNRTT